ncbi:MAG: hypothetical protein HFE59_04530 [Clostridiales bacterium]|nr:hypothetical protein [Clostridiales bacterium]
MANTILLPFFNTESLSLNLSKTQRAVIGILEKYAFDLSKVNESDINDFIEYLSENSRRINNLLRENRKLSEKVQTRLDVYSFYKKSFSRTQMRLYNDYISLKNEEKDMIKNSLSLMYNKKSISCLSNLILDDTINYKDFAKQLTSILLEQSKVIKSLNKITSKASKFLKSFR